MDVISLDLGMSVAQCRQTEASVRSRIFSIADAKEGQLQQPEDGGEHAFARETVTTQIRVDPGSDQGQRPGEHQHFAVFRLVPDFPPSLMVAILLAPLLIPSRHLDMSKRVEADPYRGPGRRDHKGLDAPQRLDVLNQRPVGLAIVETAPGLMAGDPQPVVGGMVQAGQLGRGRRIEHPDNKGVFRVPSSSTHLRN